MNFITLLQNWTKPLHQKTYDKVVLLSELHNQALDEVDKKTLELRQALVSIEDLHTLASSKKASIKQLKEELEKFNIYTDLELYCKEKFREVPKFAYKDKRYSAYRKRLIFIDMYPNELIRTEVFEIDRIRRRLGTPRKTLQWYQKVGDYVAKNMRWRSDSNTYGVLDFYSYPGETIKLGYSDCESHSGIVSSIEPEMGIVFGMAGNSAHAWNCFVLNNELYFLETNSTPRDLTQCKIWKHTNKDIYKPDWIFTKDRTFLTSAGRHFGVITR